MSATKIGTENIRDEAVTEAKLADEAVSEAKLATDAVSTAKLQDEAITLSKLAQEVIDAMGGGGGSGTATQPCVTMIRSGDSANDLSTLATWKVYDENGAEIDISASTTQGLQEAINYAAQNGFDLWVYGSGIAHPRAGSGVNYVGTLGTNPFSMNAGSPIVTVTHVGHGMQTGNWVRFPAQTTLNGIPNTEWQAQEQVTVIDADTYTVTYATNATATTTGGTGAQYYLVGQDTAIIRTTSAITIPPIQGVRWDIHATISVAGTPVGSEACITFNSCMLCDIKFTGQIVQRHASYGATVRFKPTLELPQDINGPIITDSRFTFGPTVIGTGSGTSPCIDFDISSAPISSNEFNFMEVNCAAGGTGIKVSGATGGILFDNNRINAVDIHDSTVDAVNAGTSTTSAANYTANIWNVQCDPASGDGVEIFGKSEIWSVVVTSLEGTPSVGIHLNASADGNIITVPRNDAGTKMDDDATATNNKIISPRSHVHVTRTSNQTGVVTNTATDVSWQNERIDSLGEFGSNTFTAQYSGTYHVAARIGWNLVIDNMQSLVRLLKNGVSTYGGGDALSYSSGTDANQGTHLSTLVDLKAGDTLKLQARHRYGSNNEIFTSANDENCWMTISKVA
jgi:hypothetical protein